MATSNVARNCLRQSSRSLSCSAPTFSQLATVRSVHSHSTPVLDFLAPRFASSIVNPQTSALSSGSRYDRVGVRQRKAFSTTSRRLETKAVLHPAKDDDGNDMLLDITPRAAKRLKEIMAKDSNPNLALRIQVESGGCHGFQYLLSLSTIPPLSSSSDSIPIENPPALNVSANDPNSKSAVAKPSPEKQDVALLDEEDVVFEETDSKAKVVIDVPSLELLKGSRVEFTTGLIGSQFAVINPNSSSNCGCGTSFDIKI